MPAVQPPEPAAVRPDTQPSLASVRPLEGIRQFWKTAPVDLRWLAVSLPVILMIVVWSTTRSHAKNAVPMATPIAARQPELPVPATPAVPTLPASGGSLLQRAQRMLAQRAAVQLMDDFRGGMGEWSGRPGWAHSWSYDRAGFVRIGNLALYSPSVPLTDYHMEFLAQIESRSLGWVYRAQDLDNYYATKIVISSRGPQTVGTIVRYAVIHGREVSRAELPLPLNIQKDTVYKVQMDVQGDGFTTSVQGQVVDFWSDTRLARGGIGFFSGKGEQTRLRWVELTHQADTLGKLCAALAPGGKSVQNGSSR